MLSTQERFFESVSGVIHTADSSSTVSLTPRCFIEYEIAESFLMTSSNLLRDSLIKHRCTINKKNRFEKVKSSQNFLGVKDTAE